MLPFTRCQRASYSALNPITAAVTPDLVTVGGGLSKEGERAARKEPSWLAAEQHTGPSPCMLADGSKWKLKVGDVQSEQQELSLPSQPAPEH